MSASMSASMIMVRAHQWALWFERGNKKLDDYPVSCDRALIGTVAPLFASGDENMHESCPTLDMSVSIQELKRAWSSSVDWSQTGRNWSYFCQIEKRGLMRSGSWSSSERYRGGIWGLATKRLSPSAVIAGLICCCHNKKFLSSNFFVIWIRKFVIGNKEGTSWFIRNALSGVAPELFTGVRPPLLAEVAPLFVEAMKKDQRDQIPCRNSRKEKRDLYIDFRRYYKSHWDLLQEQYIYCWDSVVTED